MENIANIEIGFLFFGGLTIAIAAAIGIARTFRSARLSDSLDDIGHWCEGDE